MKSENTKLQMNDPDNDDIRPEYNLEGVKGERGKFYRQLIAAGYRPVLLPPDVARVFEDEGSVNEALRGLIEISQKATGSNGHRKRRTAKAASLPVKA